MAKRSGQPKGKAGPGRPPVHGEPYTRINVILFNRQVAWLDHICADIRGNSGKAISRTELLRGMLDGLKAVGVQITKAESEADVSRITSGLLKS